MIQFNSSRETRVQMNQKHGIDACSFKLMISAFFIYLLIN